MKFKGEKIKKKITILLRFGIWILDKPEPDPKSIDLNLDLICETLLDLNLDFKNNLDLDISDIRTDQTRCHPYSHIYAIISPMRVGRFIFL